MSNKFPTLHDLIAANLDAATSDAGRVLTEYNLRVEVGLDGVVQLHVKPLGFDYQEHVFGVQGNGLLTEDQLAAFKTSIANTRTAEAAAAALAQAEGKPQTGSVAVPAPGGDSVSAPTLGMLALAVVLGALAVFGLLDPSLALAGILVGHTSGAASMIATPTPTPTPTPGVSPTPTPTPGAANDFAWVPATATPEVRGYVQTKGWGDPLAAIASYQELEKLVGAKGLPLPKDDKDEPGWGRVYDTLGRPKTHADYKLPVPEGADPKFAEVAGTTMHKLGLNTKQAQGLATWWNETAAEGAKVAAEARAAQSKTEEDELRKSWGGAWETNIATVSRAARTFGLDPAAVDKIDQALGTKATLELLHRIGGALGEMGTSGTNAGSAQHGAPMTPEQAKSEMKALQADPEWTKAYLNGDVEKGKRMAQLHQWAYPV